MQKTIEENFHLTHRTVRHSKPKMTKTLRRREEEIAELDAHVFTAGRTSSIKDSTRSWSLQHAVSEGLGIMVQKKELFEVGEIQDTDNEDVSHVTGDE